MTPLIYLRLKNKLLGRHTGESPEDRSRRCFDVFRGDLPYFLTQPILLCETQMVKVLAIVSARQAKVNPKSLRKLLIPEIGHSLKLSC